MEASKVVLSITPPPSSLFHLGDTPYQALIAACPKFSLTHFGRVRTTTSSIKKKKKETGQLSMN